MKEAEHYFYQKAFDQGKNEREKWIPELIEDMRKVGMAHNALDDLQNQMSSYEYKRSNSILFDKLIEHYIKIEKKPEIEEIINSMWFGLWDSTEKKNAGVYNQRFFDGSILVQFSTELEILIRKVSEIFCTVVLYEFAMDNILPKKLVDQMFEIEINDIENEHEERGVIEHISELPEDIYSFYNIIFSNVFKGACAFVLFHEVGHKLEVNTEIAKYFKIESSMQITENNENDMKKEWNADSISIQILIKMFGGHDALDWMFYSGIFVAFMALSINSRSLFEDTNHPALKNRYIGAKNLIYNKLSQFDCESIEYRLNIVGDKLSKITNWDGKKWWLMN